MFLLNSAGAVLWGTMWMNRIRVVNVCVCVYMMQIIMAKAAGGPKAPKQRGHWDKDDWDEAPDNFETHH